MREVTTDRDLEAEWARRSRFFPEDFEVGRAARGQFFVMAGFLENLREEPLGRISTGAGAGGLRVLVAPSFESVMCVRIMRDADDIRLTATLADENGHAPRRATERSLAASEWESLKHELFESGFWEMPISAPQMGMDGESWLLESFEGQEYQAVHRWSPDIPGPDEAFLRFAVGLLTLGGFEDRVADWLMEES